jgi:hypothetical protein
MLSPSEQALLPAAQLLLLLLLHFLPLMLATWSPVVNNVLKFARLPL